MLVLAATAVVVILLDLLPPRERKDHLGFVSALGVVLTLVMTYWMTFSIGGGELRGFRGMVVLDPFALFFNVVIGYATGLVILLSMDYIRREGQEAGEFYILILLSSLGMMLMASAGDLIIVFLGLETMSIALYVLTGFFRHRLEAGEASLKYFLLGAFASGFFLYGIALIFGATGSTNLDRIANAVAAGAGRDPMLAIGFGLLLVGFGFKISSVPFHMWAPDAYEGAPTSITALIATGSKAAAFASLLRVLLTALRGAPLDWPMLMWGMAAITMTVGNVVALAQQNIKRMLAYSSIAHVGYMLVGVVAGGSLGNGARALLPARVHVHHRGRLRRGPAARAQRARGGAARRLRRARHAASGAGGGPVGLPALADRHPAHRGLRRQVLPLRRRGEVGLRVAGRDRRAELRGRRLLLPAPHRVHVHARARGRADRDGPVALRRAGPGGGPLGRGAARRGPRPPLRPGPGRRHPAPAV